MKHLTCTAAVTAAFTAFAVLSGAANAARADVKIVSIVAVTGQPPRMGELQMRVSALPHTVTAYYQGDNSRTEVAGGFAVLYNGKDGTTTVLDLAGKTYFVTSGQPTGQGGCGGRGGRRMTMEGKANLKPAFGTQTLLGSQAQKYALTGFLKMNFSGPPMGPADPPPPDGSGRGTQPGGFGGRRSGPRRPQEVTLTGDMWLSDAVKLPSSDKQALMPLLRELMPGGGPLLLPFAGSVVKTRELPLLAKVTLTPTPPPARPAGQGDDAGSAPPPVPMPTVATFTVTSVSQSTLDPSLFAVPPGYTQAAPPRPFGGYRRGPGMFSGGPGPNNGPPPPDGGMDGAGPPQAF